MNAIEWMAQQPPIDSWLTVPHQRVTAHNRLVQSKRKAVDVTRLLKIIEAHGTISRPDAIETFGEPERRFQSALKECRRTGRVKTITRGGGQPKLYKFEVV